MNRKREKNLAAKNLKISTNNFRRTFFCAVVRNVLILDRFVLFYIFFVVAKS